MSHLGFVLKVFIATVLVVLIMQIKIGEETVENHAHSFLKTSSILEPLNEVAQGGAALFRSTYKNIIKTFDSLITQKFRSDNSPGKRDIVEVKRSQKYEKEQELKSQAQENQDYEME